MVRELKIFFPILIGAFLSFPSPSLLAEEQIYQPDSSSEVNCVVLKAEEKQVCEKASLICTEVHTRYAFNQIRSCAHYSETCYQKVQQEDELCGETQVSLHKADKSHHSSGESVQN